MSLIDAHICVIGAGSGGLSVAAGAAQLGRKVVLIEAGEMGGDCLNSGCVPSKALIAASARAAAMRGAAKFGIAPVEPQIDFGAVMKHVHGVIAAIAPHDSQERFEGLGVRVLRARAQFTSPRQVRAGEDIVNAKHFVIATGSDPFIPPIPGLADTPFLTNETIFSLRDRPDHLVIIGGGPIGVEMAQAFARLGAKVSLIEAVKLLNKDDPELVEVVRDVLMKDGVKLYEKAKATAIATTKNEIEVRLEDKTVSGSHLLIAVGRKPAAEGLNLESAGVAYSDKGVKVDRLLRTTNKRIYAVGDVIGSRQFTHVAGYHASIVIRNMLFKFPAANKEAEAPAVTYCDPPLAQVGLTESQARAGGDRFDVVRWNFVENDRAQTERDMAGLVKVILGKGGKILGASIVGRGADEIIQPWALAISNGLKISAFTNMIAPYPTRGEASKRAAGAYYTPRLFSQKTRRLISLLSVFD